MHLIYLPANMAWVFLFGHDINTATIQDMGGFGRFFPTRYEAVAAAAACGLSVNKDGGVGLTGNARGSRRN
jgi:hypothetical protein